LLLKVNRLIFPPFNVLFKNCRVTFMGVTHAVQHQERNISRLLSLLLKLTLTSRLPLSHPLDP